MFFWRLSLKLSIEAITYLLDALSDFHLWELQALRSRHAKAMAKREDATEVAEGSLSEKQQKTQTVQSCSINS